VGAYTRGNDPAIDLAIDRYPWLEAYLRQGMQQRVDVPRAFDELNAVLNSEQ